MCCGADVIAVRQGLTLLSMSTGPSPGALVGGPDTRQSDDIALRRQFLTNVAPVMETPTHACIPHSPRQVTTPRSIASA